MKILPCMAKEIVLLHEDGTFEMAPFQIFRSASGQTIIRIGRNTLWFGEDGRFDGTEAKAGSDVDLEAFRAALEVQGKCRGLPPDVAYFPPGAPAFEAETRSWPTAERSEDEGETYITVPKKPRMH